jgi:hypothetical protein
MTFVDSRLNSNSIKNCHTPLLLTPLPSPTHHDEPGPRIFDDPEPNSAPSERLRLADPAGIGGWEHPAGGQKAGGRFGESLLYI